MNLVEEYILRNGEIIILISGLSGSKRSLLAKEIERDFKVLKLISLDDYCNENNVPIIELFGQKVRDWDNIIVYDWEKFNNDINNNKKSGVVAFGDTFPKDKLKFDTKFHIHITITKEKLIEKRHEFIEQNPEKCKDMVFFLDKLNALINKTTFSHYITNRKDSKISLWLNSDEDTLDKMYDKTFDYIINEMKNYLNEYYAMHERKFDFVKMKDNKESGHKDNKKHKNRDSNSSDINSHMTSDSSSSDSTDSTTETSDSSSSDSSSDSSDSSNSSNSDNKHIDPFDELENAYREENNGNISLGSYNDLKLEAQFVN
jgi:uridine kinase